MFKNDFLGLSSVSDDSEDDQKYLRLRDAWCLHGYLTAAAEELNSMYSVQLLVWFATLTFNTISRIYAFSTREDDINVFRDIRESILAIFFIATLTLLAAICHLTANEVGNHSNY